MCKQSSSTQTVVQNPTIPDWLSTSFQNLATRAQGVSDRPYNPAVQKNVADFTPDQLQAFSQVRADQGIYQPYMDAATGYAQIGGSPISAGQIANYSNPFQSQVIDATMANIQQNNAIQANNLRGNAALQGGLGNDRLGVAQAELARNQNLATNQTLATLNAQNFNQALGAAQGDRTAAQQAASQFANLGGNMQSMANRDAAALLQTGGLQQGLTQTQLDTTSGNIAQQEQYPFATASWLGGMLQGASPSFTGSQQTSTTPGPSTLSQIAGLGMLGYGLLSDERAKENIEPIGQDFGGNTIYRFNYKGSPETEIGYIAQEIAETNPEAVGVGPDGFLRVDYKDVTDDLAQPEREGFNSGGYTVGGTYSVDKNNIIRMSQQPGQATPYGVSNTVPQQSMTAGSMLGSAPVKKLPAPKSRSGQMYDEAKDIADDMRGMQQAGQGLAGMADQGMRGLGGVSMKPFSSYGPPVPEGLADGGRVDYAMGGPVYGGVAGPGNEMIPGTPFYTGTAGPYPQFGNVPAPMPAARPQRAPGLGSVAMPAVPATAQDGPGTNGMSNPSGEAFGPPVPAGLGAASDAGQTIAGAQGSNGLFGGLASDPVRMAMISAGLGTLAGTSPHAMANIGRGGLAGMGTYNQVVAAEQAKAQRAADEAHRKTLLDMRIAEFKAEQALREAESARRARLEPLELEQRQAQIDAARRQAAEPGFAERQRLETEELIRREREKQAIEDERLRRRAEALGLVPPATGGASAPSASAPAERSAPPVAAAAPSPSSNDPYTRLVTPAVPPEQAEAKRKERAARAMLMGDEKGAAKILSGEEDPKEYQVKDAAWAERMARAEIALRGVTGDIDPEQGPTQYNPGARSNALWFDNSMWNSSNWKQFQGNAREWIAALLRKDTGAAVTQSEWDLYFPTYFPQPGDPPEVQAEKLRRRVETARGLRASSGPAFDRQNPNFDTEMRQRITDQNGGPARPVQPPLPAIDDLRKNRDNPRVLKAFADKYGVDPRNYLMD